MTDDEETAALIEREKSQPWLECSVALEEAAKALADANGAHWDKLWDEERDNYRRPSRASVLAFLRQEYAKPGQLFTVYRYLEAMIQAVERTP